MVGTADIVIFAVKQYDTKAAAKLIVPLITNETAVISIQNGMDPHERLKTIVGREHVMGGTTYITGAKVMSPGIITHTGSIARLVFGEYDGSVSLRGERFLNTCWFLPVSAKKCGKIRAAFRVQRSKQHVAQGGQTNNERS